MVAFIKQWLVYRELLALSRKQNFTDTEPERIVDILERFAVSRLSFDDLSVKAYLSLVFARKANQKGIDHRYALMRIWELAKERYVHDTSSRARWHKVMACCNALYEPYSRVGFVQHGAAVA